MKEPPESEMPCTGVATGPGIEKETGVVASFEAEGSSDSRAAPAETSNVIPFRRPAPEHPYEIVEISFVALGIPQQFVISLAGPASDEHRSILGNRFPLKRVARFSVDDAADAAAFAHRLAAEYGIPIYDYSPLKLNEPGNGPEAA